MPRASRPRPRPAAGTPAEELGNGELIAQVIRELAAKQQHLSRFIDGYLDSESLSIGELARLLALYGQNASRLGRLLRDKRALSGDAADGIAGAIGQALDELATEWGIEL